VIALVVAGECKALKAIVAPWSVSVEARTYCPPPTLVLDEAASPIAIKVPPASSPAKKLFRPDPEPVTLAITRILELTLDGVIVAVRPVTNELAADATEAEKESVLVVETTCKIPPVVAKLFFQALPSYSDKMLESFR
jgi:hypothetical protein